MTQKHIKNEMIQLMKLSIALDKEQHPKARKMLKQGMSAMDVAKKYKISLV